MNIDVHEKINDGVNNTRVPQKILSFEFALKSTIKFF